jgi:hypothetical protein
MLEDKDVEVRLAVVEPGGSEGRAPPRLHKALEDRAK